MLAPETSLGPYKILSALGSGGIGEVYRARDPRLGRDVAIKVLTEHFAKDPEALARFQREAKALAALSHPNILAVFDVGSEADVTYVVTELLEGETLRARINQGVLPWRKAVEIGIAVAEGLSAAHSRGVIHRDLKPDNVFLTSDGVVKILDFGLARMQNAPQDANSDPSHSTDTQPGTMIGTLHYMSPEQVRGMPSDQRGDIFSFGCLLYEMVTATRPFSKETVAETLTAILKEDPNDVSKAGVSIPQELQEVILHCLEKDPGERFQSARDLTFHLKTIHSSANIPAKPRAPFTSPRPYRMAALIVFLLLIAGLGYRITRQRSGTEALAILPLVNAGGDPNLEYLSDGISESIINNLSQLPQLRVIARTTAFRYKNQDLDLKKIGQDLHIGTLLTGKVFQRGDTLVIQVDLVNVADGMQIWGSQYSRKLADIFVIQDEIAGEISEKLQFRLTGQQKERLRKHYTDNPEAYQLYLQGRYYSNKRTADGLQTAIKYFQQAVEKDGDYALAYSGMADSYCLLGSPGYEVFPPRDVLPEAKEAATRALKLDEALAEAHTSIAAVLDQYDWDQEAAEKEYKRAIELNPGYSLAHHWYGFFLTEHGRFNMAIQELKRAQELDPFSLIVNANLGLPYYANRQFDPAIRQYQKTLEMEPNFYITHYLLGLVYQRSRNFPRAIEELEKAVILSGESPDMLAATGSAYAESGNRARAEEVLGKLQQLNQSRYVSPYLIATIHAALGANDSAFECLEKAYQDRSGWMVFLKVDPHMDSLRSDPRFAEMIRRVGLSTDTPGEGG